MENSSDDTFFGNNTTSGCFTDTMNDPFLPSLSSHNSYNSSSSSETIDSNDNSQKERQQRIASQDHHQIVPVLLRKFKLPKFNGADSDNSTGPDSFSWNCFVDSKLSPDRRLLALRDFSCNLYLYFLEKEILVPNFILPEICSYDWIFINGPSSKVALVSCSPQYLNLVIFFGFSSFDYGISQKTSPMISNINDPQQSTQGKSSPVSLLSNLQKKKWPLLVSWATSDNANEMSSKRIHFNRGFQEDSSKESFLQCFQFSSSDLRLDSGIIFKAITRPFSPKNLSVHSLLIGLLVGHTDSNGSNILNKSEVHSFKFSNDSFSYVGNYMLHEVPLMRYKCFNFEQIFSALEFTSRSGWLFVIGSEYLLIYNLVSGLCHGGINMKSLFDMLEIERPRQLGFLEISPDLRYLIIVAFSNDDPSGKSIVLFLDLDEYFKYNPHFPSNCSFAKKHKCSSVMNIENVRFLWEKGVMHWYEIIDFLPFASSLSSVCNERNTLNGLDAKNISLDVQEKKQTNYSSSALTPLPHGLKVWEVCFPIDINSGAQSYLFRTCYDSRYLSLLTSFNSSLCCGGTEVTLLDCFMPEEMLISLGPGLIVLTDDNWLFLKDSGLYAAVSGHSPEELINNVVMYNSGNKADILCTVNSWNRSFLPLHVLRLGLRYKQLDVIGQALSSIESTQEIDASKMLFTCVQQFSCSVSEMDFTRRLLAMAMTFCCKVISESTEDDVIHADQDNIKVLHFSSMLEELRSFHHNLKTCHRKTPEIRAVRPISSKKRKSKTCRSLFPEESPLFHRYKDKDEHSSEIRESNPTSIQSDAFVRINLIPERFLGEDLIERWEALEFVELVRDALISGNTSLLLAYLRWLPKREHISKEIGTYGFYCLNDIRETGFKLIYQAFCEGNVSRAKKMLENLVGGKIEETNNALQELLLHSCRSGVRRLVNVLMTPPPSFQEDITFISQVEDMITSPLFFSVYKLVKSAHVSLDAPEHFPSSRLTARRHMHYILSSNDLDDVTPSTENKFDFQKLNSLYSQQISRAKISLPPIFSNLDLETVKKSSLGYFQTSVAWIHEWNDYTRKRVLAEINNRLGNAISFDIAYFHFLLSHNDSQGLHAMIQQIPSEQIHYFIHDLLGTRPSDDIAEANSQNSFRLATRYVSRRVMSAFAEKNALVSPLLVPSKIASSQSLKSDFFESCLQDICCNEKLFRSDLYLDTSNDGLEPRHGQTFNLPANWIISRLSHQYSPIVGSSYLLGSCLSQSDFEKCIRICDELNTVNTYWVKLIATLGSVPSEEEILDMSFLNAWLLLDRKDEFLIPHDIGIANICSFEPVLGIAISQYSSEEVMPYLGQISISEFPTLSAALKLPVGNKLSNLCHPLTDRNLYSLMKDVSLFELLDYHCNFRFGSFFESVFCEPTILHFRNERLLHSRAYTACIDDSFYLMKGWPCQGYLASVSNSQFYNNLGNNGIIKFLLEHYYDELLVVSGLCFLELNKWPSFPVKVDIAAMRIISMNKDNAYKKQIIEDFLLLNGSNSDVSLRQKVGLKILSHLEKCKPGEHHKCFLCHETDYNINIKDSMFMACFERTRCLFSNVHSLPLNTSLLVDFASSNSWLPFLFHSQLYVFPPALVLDVLNKYSEPGCLQEHLEVILRPFCGEEFEVRIATQDINLVAYNFIKNGFPENDSLFENLKSLPSTSLPSFCLSTLFILKATQENDVLKLLMTWLHGVLPEGIMHMDYSLVGLGRLITVLCEQRCLINLLNAFLIFDPLSPLVHYFRFYRSILIGAFDAAAMHLRFFVEEIEESLARRRSLGIICQDNTRWIEGLAVSLTNALISSSSLDTCCRNYELGHLLKVIHECKLGSGRVRSRFQQLFFTFQLLRRTHLNIDIDTDPSTIIQRLVENGSFSEAADYAVSMNIDSQHIFITQARELIRQHKSGSLWRMRSERERLWKRIHSFFLENKVDSELAGKFFYSQFEENEKQPVAQEIDVRERIEVLSLAYAWFSGNQLKIINHDHTHLLPPSPHGACRTLSFLQELETRILLMDISVQVNHPSLLTKSGLENQKTALDVIVGSLLDSGHLDKAKAICLQFGHSCLDVHIVDFVLSLGSGSFNWSLDMIPDLIRNKIFSEPLDEHHKTLLKDRDILGLLKLLEGIMTHAHKCIHRMFINFLVAFETDSTYSEISTAKPDEVLSILLRKGRDSFDLTRQYIEVSNLDLGEVAKILAKTFFHSVLDSCSGDKYDETMINSLNHENFSNFVNLCQKPYDVGMSLLSLFSEFLRDEHGNIKQSMDISGKISVLGEVELILKTYTCFELAGSQSGCEQILEIIHARHQSYVAAGESKLLVVLLVYTKAYQELCYMFDILMQHNQFSLLLGSNLPILDPVGLTSFLVKYIQINVAENERSDLLCQLWERFGYYRDIADFVYAQAEEAVSKYSSISGNIDENELLGVLDLFLKAADFYELDSAFEKSVKCLNKAALISLQIQLPDTRILNLSHSEVRQLMAYRGIFYDTLIICNGYGMNEMEEWIGPLYRQVVVNGNFSLFNDFCSCFHVSSHYFIEICKRFKADLQRSMHTHNMKQLLSKISDKYVAYDLAMDLGFSDITAEFKKTIPGLNVFRRSSLDKST